MYLLFSFTVGGTEKLVTNICNEMNRQGQKVYLYIVNRYYSEDMLRGLVSGVKIQLQNRKPGHGNIIKVMWKIEQYVRQNQIEVIHCNSFDSPELLIFAKILHPSVRIVYTIHDVQQWNKLNKLRSMYRNLICSQIIAISKSVQHDIVSSGAKDSKVTVVYNAIDLEKFNRRNESQTNNKIKGLASIGDRDVFIIGNVARIMPNKKGQDILINAFAKVKVQYPQIKCIFAGGADVENLKEFEELKLIAAQFEGCIEFLGTVTDIPCFLKEIDLFVLPSRFEGFGIALIEAMALGIPCIASNLDGPAEIIGKEERGLLFTSEDVNALAEKIVYALEHYDEMLKVAKSAEVYVRNHFDIKNICRQLLSLYVR